MCESLVWALQDTGLDTLFGQYEEHQCKDVRVDTSSI